MNHYEARLYAQRACVKFLRYCEANPVVNLPQPLLVKPATPPPPKLPKAQSSRGLGRKSGLLDQIRQHLVATNTPATLDQIAEALGFDERTKQLALRTLHNAVYCRRGIAKAGHVAHGGTRPVVLWSVFEWERKR